MTRILLFELASSGHRAEYIKHLIGYFYSRNIAVELGIVIPPEFETMHPDVVNAAVAVNENGKTRITFLPMKEEHTFFSRISFPLFLKAFQYWNLLKKYAASFGAEHCIAMYCDSLLLPFFMNSFAKLPWSFSGIYFRPTFHYQDFPETNLSFQEKITAFGKYLLIRSVMRSQNLKVIFSLDPFASDFLRARDRYSNIIQLPDPVKIDPDDTQKAENIKARYQLFDERKTFLLFGSLNERKGIIQLIDAVYFLPRSLQGKIRILLTGSLNKSIRSQVQMRCTKANQETKAHVILDDRFIPSDEIQAYFYAADVIVIPYQRHVGMSGIQVRAAAAQKPILSSNYGLLGELTLRRKLGVAIDTEDPKKIAEGISRFFSSDIDELVDFNEMLNFASENASQKFGETIFNQILRSD